MEKKKLKKLSIKKMNELPVIPEQEQMAIKGGNDYVWSDEFNSYMIPEVEVPGDNIAEYADYLWSDTDQYFVEK